MPVARMKMRPWLEKMIESNKVPGLAWVDKDQKMFSITWKHAARHGWQVERDASLFKYWAIHTGKFKEGVDDLDPKKWKANFRCAMNSLPDVEQVKCKSVNKGQQAVRVYRMVTVTATKDKRTKSKEGKRRNKARSEMDFSDTQSSSDQTPSPIDHTFSPQDNRVDSTEQDMMPVSASEVPDYGNTITIGLDSSDYLYNKFEVSPQHSTVFEDTDIIQICQQLEQERKWMQYTPEDTGMFQNDLLSDSNSSPQSQWSDTSSGDVLDMRLYTVLGKGNVSYSDDTWREGPQYTPCEQIDFLTEMEGQHLGDVHIKTCQRS